MRCAWGKGSSTCVEGKMQSPVDLVAHSGKAQPKLDISYTNPSNLEIFGTMKWKEVSPNPPKFYTESATYNLSEVHCHIGSEHTINGSQYPASFQFLHKSGNTYVAIVVFISDTARSTNAAWDDAIQKGVNFFWSTAIPRLNLRYYWEYTGSLTTPNCEENVQWIILRDAFEITSQQFQTFKDSHKVDGNFRDTMPLNGRALRDGSEIGSITVLWYIVTGYLSEASVRTQLHTSLAEVLRLSEEEMVEIHILKLHGHGIQNLYDVEYMINVINNTKSYVDWLLEELDIGDIDRRSPLTREVISLYEAETNDTLKYFTPVRASVFNSTFSEGDDGDRTTVIIIVVVSVVVICLCFIVLFQARKKKMAKEVAVEVSVGNNVHVTAM